MVGINTNIAAQNAQANLSAANSTVSKSVGKLSSGNRIINASDDVAGLAIGTKLQSNVTALQIGLLNANQAGTVLQIADGALKQVGDILSRQKALAVQANSGSLSNTERGFLNQEFTKLTSEIDRIVDNTNFNGITLLNGSISGSASTSVSAPASYSSVVTSGTLSTVLTAAPTLTSFDDATVQGQGIGTITALSFDDNGGSAAETATFRATVGDKVYVSNLVTSSSGSGGGDLAAQTITFTSTDGTSSFALDIAAQTGAIGSNATGFASTLTTAVSNIEIFQNRTLSSTVSSAVSNTVAEGIGSVSIRSDSFDVTNNDFGDISSFTAVAGSRSANSLSVVVNGKTFNATDLGGSGDVLSSADTLVLTGRDSAGNDTLERITITISSLTQSIDVTNQDELSAFASALNGYFGVGSSNGSNGLSFQVGSSVDDKIDVSISDVNTVSIYKNDAGVSTTLSIDTADNARTAADVLDNAINTIVARRADVGSLQSRFNFASANLQTSIANQDAARGSFLDADISSESTVFANAQVKLQASVSVLAQANQLPQNLLKLLQ